MIGTVTVVGTSQPQPPPSPPPVVVPPPPASGNGTIGTTASVSNAPGSSVLGCETTDECFVPANVTIAVGGEVTWTNDDTAAHTVTSGTVADGPDGVFDSGLLLPNAMFAHTFEDAGEYPYYCVVHPWMIGTVTVVVPPPLPVASVPIVVELGSVSGGAPVNVTSTGAAANLTINVTGLVESGGPPLNGSESSTVAFPPFETTVITSFAEVSFPPSVTASHVPADGLLALRISSEALPPDEQVQGALAYGGSGRVEPQRIVEVGAGSNGAGGTPRVTFDQPVRILLEGQAGGRAFYIQGADGEITPIDAACAADVTDRVHLQLGGAGECQIDSNDGTDKIIYTYHFTRFGTVLSESGAPPPVVHTCSARLAVPSLDVSAVPGDHSPVASQALINSGSLPFAGVELEATPWYVDWGGSAPPPPAADHPSLPASISEVFAPDHTGILTGATAVDGTVVARGVEGGSVEQLWFRIDLTSYAEVPGSALDQYVTYLAQCDR